MNTQLADLLRQIPLLELRLSLTAYQVRFGRGLAGLNANDLAVISGVARKTITMIEQGQVVTTSTIEAVRKALLKVGITFDDDGSIHLRALGAYLPPEAEVLPLTGEKLRRWREACRLTAVQVAGLAGVVPGTVRKIEATDDLTDFRETTLAAILVVLTRHGCAFGNA
jgi:transcriptional regulator with XRE-family HTH domain